MKYLPVVNLWDAETHAAITSGRLKLQRGQWVSCGGRPLSRWIGYNGVTMEVAHGGNGREVIAKFKTVCQIKRDTVARFGKE
jgi:hypothetical protein